MTVVPRGLEIELVHDDADEREYRDGECDREVEREARLFDEFVHEVHAPDHERTVGEVDDVGDPQLEREPDSEEHVHPPDRETGQNCLIHSLLQPRSPTLRTLYQPLLVVSRPFHLLDCVLLRPHDRLPGLRVRTVELVHLRLPGRVVPVRGELH